MQTTAANSNADAVLCAAIEELEARVGPTTLAALGISPTGRILIEATFGSGQAGGGTHARWALGCGAHAREHRLGRWCPRCPASHHTNRLSPIDRDHTPPPSQALAHAFLTDGATVLGHLTSRDGVDPGREREALVGVRRALAAWHDRAPRDVEVAHVLLSASGRRMSWSPGASEWLSERWDEVASRLRDRIDDPDSPPVVVDGYVASFTPMEQGRRHAYLVCFMRPNALTIDWSHGLGPRQLEVANMASAGHNNPHIANALGISRDTVKYHLKQTFELLQVDSRGELAALLGDHAHGCI